MKKGMQKLGEEADWRSRERKENAIKKRRKKNRSGNTRNLGKCLKKQEKKAEGKEPREKKLRIARVRVKGSPEEAKVYKRITHLLKATRTARRAQTSLKSLRALVSLVRRRRVYLKLAVRRQKVSKVTSRR